mmetsp:Transcript_10795/g.24672  ORF Transcript_10795/g.24672 Transcript_10795/m.24672 type:complete len:468 (-) Transcript_10795:95-1498(-)
MPRRRARSRSPHRIDTGKASWISKSVTAFVRYEKNRPAGLTVSPEGHFYVDELIEVWGCHHGLTEKLVLEALRLHLFKEDYTVRFSIDDDGGRSRVKVAPKSLFPSSSSHAQALALSDGAASSGGSSRPTTQDKLDMALEDVIRTEVPARSPPVQRSGPEVFVIDSDDGSDGAPRGPHPPRRTRKTGHRSRFTQRPRAAGPPKQQQQSLSEQLCRWISWIVRVGHNELGIEVTPDGRIALNALAHALQVHRSELGELDVNALKTVVEAADQRGRFAISEDGYLRKVPRAERLRRAPASQLQPQSERAESSFEQLSRRLQEHLDADSSAALFSVPSSPELPAEEELTGGQDQQVSPSRDAAMHGADADSILAARFSALVGLQEEELDADFAAPSLEQDEGQADAGSTTQPSPPPGEHWTPYVDEDQKPWYHYDGPLGEFYYREGEGVMRVAVEMSDNNDASVTVSVSA